MVLSHDAERVRQKNLKLNFVLACFKKQKYGFCLHLRVCKEKVSDENDEDNSDSYKQGVECWIRGNHGNHENDENHENPGCKPRVPQPTGLEIPEFYVNGNKPWRRYSALIKEIHAFLLN